MYRSRFLGSSVGLALIATVVASGAPSCGNGDTSARPNGVNSTGSGGAPDGSAGSNLFGNAGTFFIDASLNGEASVGSIQITPATPIIDVTVVDGVVTQITGPDGGMITFQASSSGQLVSPMWSIDKGELGTINVATGEFATTGKFSGVAKIGATLGTLIASTTLTIRLHVTQNGRGTGAMADAGVGGIGGVGGEGLGGPVSDATQDAIANRRDSSRQRARARLALSVR